MAQNKLDEVIQNAIPIALVLLLTASIVELFYNISEYYLLIDFFDIFVILIFAIDLGFRYKESKNLSEFLKLHWLDIIATIPFNLIFLGIDYLNLLRGLKGISLIARYSRLLRLARFSTRIPRLARMRKHMKKAEIKEISPHQKELHQVLGFKVILLVTINSIMGTGIWFLTAAGAKHAGPASLISWGVLSVISIYIAMCFSELTSMFPKAGGVYEFAKQTYGRFWSFVVGWTTSIAGSVTISMLLLGALQYMIPIRFSAYYIPIAIALIILFNFIAYRGMQTSMFMLVGFALITLATITAIIVPGFFSFNPENFTPFFVFPSINMLLAIFFIAETFFGWESAIFLSAETKDPKRIMPKALIYGTGIIALFAFLLAFTSMGVIPWQEYAESVAPLRDLGSVYFGTIGKIIFTILVSTSIIGAVASWIVTAPRLLMSLAEDKLFFVHFAKVHPKHKSPYVSIVFQAVVISILVIIGSGSYETLLHLLIPLVLIMYSAVLLSVVILRIKRPDIKRTFKVPFGKIGPIITVCFMGFLMYMFLHETHGAFDLLRISLSLIAFGIPAYFAIEIFYDDKYITMRKNLYALFLHYYHLPKIPRPLFKQTCSLLGLSAEHTHNKKLVFAEYGCGIGQFARYMLKRNMEFEKFYGIDSSKEQLRIFKENVSQKNKDLFVLHTTNKNNVPKNIKNVDVFICFHNLGYIEDIPHFLKKVSKILKKRGKFCFYVKNSFINMAPNALILEDKKKIIQLFAEQGFAVHFHQTRGHIKQDIFIVGTRT